MKTLRKIFALVLVLTLMLCGCSQNGSLEKSENEQNLSLNSTEEGISTATEKNEVTTKKESYPVKKEVEVSDKDLTAELDEICRNYGAVGVQLAVINNFNVIETYNYGYADEEKQVKVNSDTKFRIASLSKLVTSIVFMKLVDEGLVNLESDISDYLGIKVRNPQYPNDVITPAMLMTHVSSIIDSQEFLASRWSGSSTAIEDLLTDSESFAAYAPGAGYEYSNFSYAIIGSICERVTNKNFDVLAKEYIFEPLSIDASFVASGLKDVSKLGKLYGEGGLSIEQQLSEKFSSEIGQTHHIVQGNLTISAKDYMKIICTLMDGEKTSQEKILSEDSIKALTKNRFDAGYYGVGCGLRIQSNIIENVSLYTHIGCNFGMFSAFAFDKKTGNGVVVLTSGADGYKNEGTQIYDVCLKLIQCVYPK